MKLWIFISFFLLHLNVDTSAQQYTYIKKPALGIHFILNDFKSADYIRNHSLGDAFSNGQFGRLKTMDAGLALSYQQGISNHFDFAASLSGSFLTYTLHDGHVLDHNSLLLEMEASVYAKLFNDNHLLDPYLQAGIGGSNYGIWYGAFAHAGAGLQVRLSGEAYLLINAQYRAGLTSMVNDHFWYGIGVIGNLFSRKVNRKKPPAKVILPVAEITMDTDGDGVPDSLDACPNIVGTKQYNGCPDTDGDGIPDNLDKCPTIPGSARYGGCPVTDTDGDGIDDENDSCPTVAGMAKYHGCPIPDTDGDGVNDEIDKCPTLAGSAENEGCPLVKKEIAEKIRIDAKNIYFETGSYTLSEKSFRPLNDVIKILQNDTNLRLDIEGHTDNVGTAVSNQLLSENRAKKIRSYLQANGHIDDSRLSATGYGLSKPVANNKIASGRALNRRVELKLKY